MSQIKYTNIHVNISENQKQNLKRAMGYGEPLSIRLSYEDLCGDDVIALTNLQLSRMKKAYRSGKGVTIKMSKAQLRCTKIKEGFLGTLLPAIARLASKALPFLAKTILPTLATGALSGVGGYLA